MVFTKHEFRPGPRSQSLLEASQVGQATLPHAIEREKALQEGRNRALMADISALGREPNPESAFRASAEENRRHLHSVRSAQELPFSVRSFEQIAHMSALRFVEHVRRHPFLSMHLRGDRNHG